MANNRGKEVVDDDEYHSQPAPKASKWIFQKRRRQPNEKSENVSSSSTLIQNTEEEKWTIRATVVNSTTTEFRDILILKESKFAAKYANGTHELYPPFWEVDYVYIPLRTRVVEDWYLVRINLQTMELVQYSPNKGYAKDYRRLIQFPTMDVLPLKFDLVVR
ncbi:hypothetical protein E3N88_43329 [Mikania micrantha]|uniref:Uncharacterized protein n=1 Tax=Mikania micrantha TaxID=192012 RepID=A0A5N6LF60_9ASTR|nr:hypothetical protein E3N88_43329 [Mikania micrantha]